LKKTTLLFSFLVVLFLGITYSQSVHAEENLLFEPDPKPADAHTEDQSVENLKKYLEMGYVQVDSLTNSYVKELINNGEITTQEAQTKIKVFTHPHYSSKDSLLNCDSSKNLSSSDFSIQACWGNPSAVIAVGPAVTQQQVTQAKGVLQFGTTIMFTPEMVVHLYNLRSIKYDILGVTSIIV
jgi:hypothetical protein